MQLGRKLGAGRAGADDGDVQLAGKHRPLLGVRADTGIHQPMVEAHGLRRRFQRHREFRDAGRAEIVGHAADGDHQRVVADRPRRGDLAAFLVERGGEAHLLGGAIEPDHLAKTASETVPVRLREIVHLVDAGIHAAGRDRVQQRLPQVHPRAFDQHHPRPGTPAEPVAEARHELETARAAADHDDPVQVLWVERWFGSRPHPGLVAGMARGAIDGRLPDRATSIPAAAGLARACGAETRPKPAKMCEFWR